MSNASWNTKSVYKSVDDELRVYPRGATAHARFPPRTGGDRIGFGGPGRTSADGGRKAWMEVRGDGRSHRRRRAHAGPTLESIVGGAAAGSRPYPGGSFDLYATGQHTLHTLQMEL